MSTTRNHLRILADEYLGHLRGATRACHWLIEEKKNPLVRNARDTMRHVETVKWARDRVKDLEPRIRGALAAELEARTSAFLCQLADADALTSVRDAEKLLRDLHGEGAAVLTGVRELQAALAEANGEFDRALAELASEEEQQRRRLAM